MRTTDGGISDEVDTRRLLDHREGRFGTQRRPFLVECFRNLTRDLREEVSLLLRGTDRYYTGKSATGVEPTDVYMSAAPHEIQPDAPIDPNIPADLYQYSNAEFDSICASHIGPQIEMEILDVMGVPIVDPDTGVAKIERRTWYPGRASVLGSVNLEAINNEEFGKNFQIRVSSRSYVDWTVIREVEARCGDKGIITPAVVQKWYDTNRSLWVCSNCDVRKATAVYVWLRSRRRELLWAPFSNGPANP